MTKKESQLDNLKYEEQELSHISDKELSSRVNLPDDQWITRPK